MVVQGFGIWSYVYIFNCLCQNSCFKINTIVYILCIGNTCILLYLYNNVIKHRCLTYMSLDLISHCFAFSYCQHVYSKITDCADRESPTYANPLKYFPYYTRHACYYECLLRYLHERCLCKAYNQPGEYVGYWKRPNNGKDIMIYKSHFIMKKYKMNCRLNSSF